MADNYDTFTKGANEMSEPCLCGDPECRRCFPAGTVDYEPFLESALERAVEIIMLFGEYPQPNKSKKPFQRTVARQFDLYTFLENNLGFIEYAHLLEYFIVSMNDYSLDGSFSELRRYWEKSLEKELTKHLRDSELVRGLAQQYAEEE